MRSKLDVGVEVAELSDLSRDELIARWRKIYGTLPPKSIRQELMLRAVTWHHQAKHLGGMSAKTRRLLRSATSRVEGELLARDKRSDTAHDRHLKIPGDEKKAGERATGESAAAVTRERRRLSPGARLLREWRGKTHVVDVIDGGYVFEAKVYASLTAVAEKITATHRSGPGFFGL